jgi:hypothetical protein
MREAQNSGMTRQEPSAAALGAALEISRRLPVGCVYSQALAESFAEIIEQHTRCRELLAACELAKEALGNPFVSSQAGRQQRETAVAALERALRSG